MIPAIGRTMTTGAEMETVSPENAGAPSYASGGSAHHTGRRRRLGRRQGGDPQLVPQHPADLRCRLERLHQLMP